MQEIINIESSKIIPYANNPRNNKKAIDKVASSIKEFGFKRPLVLDKENVIVVGHTRFEAAKKLGIKEIPCIIADDLTQAQIKAYRIADNKVGEEAEWDLEKLNIEFEELKETDFDLELTGFNLDEINIDEEQEEIIEDDFDLVKEQPSKVKRGDIWKLGNNYLMCGDSFSEEIGNLIGDKKADLGFCDPPYNLDKDEWISNLKHVKEGSPILLMAGDRQAVRLANKIPNFRQFIIHDREQAMLVNTATPMSQHTLISVFCDHPKKYFVNLNDHFTSIIKCKKNYKTANDEMASKMGNQ